MSPKRARRRILEAALVAEDVMTSHPASIRPTTTVAQAMAALQEMDVRHLPVINEGRELVGVISDRDLRGLPFDAAAAGQPAIPLETPVSDVMSSDVLSVELETGLDEIIDLMLDQKVGAVPVVDDRGVLAGIVSYVDLLREFQRARA